MAVASTRGPPPCLLGWRCINRKVIRAGCQQEAGSWAEPSDLLKAPIRAAADGLHGPHASAQSTIERILAISALVTNQHSLASLLDVH